MMRLLAVICGLLCLPACGKEGEVYDRSLEETRTVLRTVEVPLHYFGSSADVSAIMSAPDDHTFVWKVSSEGSDVLRYTATLEPQDEHRTRVTLAIDGATSGKFGDVAKRMESHKAIKNLYFATMTEATDSAMEARPFDTTRFYPQIAAASMASIAKLQAPESSNQKK